MLLLQWAKAQLERGVRSPIVVLANAPKAELDAMVGEIRAETGMDIMAREGLPYKLDDLDLVGAADAKIVIIMDPMYHLQGEVCSRLCTACRLCQCRAFFAVFHQA
jgi:hypothetical protein